MKVKHLNLTAGAVVTAEFEVKSSAFLVKNFTGGDIKVCLGEGMTENYVTIPSKSFEVIEKAFVSSATEAYTDKVTIEASMEGNVEIRAIQCS